MVRNSQKTLAIQKSHVVSWRQICSRKKRKRSVSLLQMGLSHYKPYHFDRDNIRKETKTFVSQGFISPSPRAAHCYLPPRFSARPKSINHRKTVRRHVINRRRKGMNRSLARRLHNLGMGNSDRKPGYFQRFRNFVSPTSQALKFMAQLQRSRSVIHGVPWLLGSIPHLFKSPFLFFLRMPRPAGHISDAVTDKRSQMLTPNLSVGSFN